MSGKHGKKTLESPDRGSMRQVHVHYLPVHDWRLHHPGRTKFDAGVESGLWRPVRCLLRLQWLVGTPGPKRPHLEVSSKMTWLDRGVVD